MAKIRLIHDHERVHSVQLGPTLDRHTIHFANGAQHDLDIWLQTNLVGISPGSFWFTALHVCYHRSMMALYAKALENVNLKGDSVVPEAAEFARRARDAAEAIIILALDPNQAFHRLFPYSCQPEVVDVAFSGLLYLKLSRLFPPAATPAEIVTRCFALQAFLRECRQVRYALTIRVATERYARAVGAELPAGSAGHSGVTTTGPGTPTAQQVDEMLGELVSAESVAGLVGDLPAEWAVDLPSWLEGGSAIDLDKDWDWQTTQAQDQLFMPM